MRLVVRPPSLTSKCHRKHINTALHPTMDKIKHLDDIVEAELTQSRTPRGSLVPKEQLPNMEKELRILQLQKESLVSEEENLKNGTSVSNGQPTKATRKASLEEETKFGEFLKMINSSDAEKNR